MTVEEKSKIPADVGKYNFSLKKNKNQRTIIA